MKLTKISLKFYFTQITLMITLTLKVIMISQLILTQVAHHGFNEKDCNTSDLSKKRLLSIPNSIQYRDLYDLLKISFHKIFIKINLSQIKKRNKHFKELLKGLNCFVDKQLSLHVDCISFKNQMKQFLSM